jgi:hypothetical protein
MSASWQKKKRKPLSKPNGRTDGRVVYCFVVADLHAIASHSTDRAPNLRNDGEGREPEERRPDPSQGGAGGGEAVFLP